ncbi:hypothetical protein A6V36_11925 [Paraburkholderia ginsengiterrae]|nr:hypothetical protein A6V36_11925 [Paraburkholderia ginsengiterrae]
MVVPDRTGNAACASSGTCWISDRIFFTSWPSLQDDIRSAGGHWVEARVVEVGKFISCGKPELLSELGSKLIARR